MGNDDDFILWWLNLWVCVEEERVQKKSKAACLTFLPWQTQSDSFFHQPEFQRKYGKYLQHSAKDTAACNYKIFFKITNLIIFKIWFKDFLIPFFFLFKRKGLFSGGSYRFLMFPFILGRRASLQSF